MAQGTLLSALLLLEWEGNQQRGDICVSIADSLCCITKKKKKTNTAF